MFWLLLRALAAVRRALGLIGRGFGGLGGFDWLRVWLVGVRGSCDYGQ